MASPGDVIGSAFVEIRPEVSAFEGMLQQGLSGPMQRTGSMMGKIFTGAAVGLGGIATAAFAAINHTVDLGQAAYEMGEKFGLSGKQASTFIAVGKLVGVSSDQMGIGMRTLSKQLNTTAIDLKSHASAATLNKLPLQELGIASTDASGNLRDMNSVLGDVADRFATMPDGPQKAALATQLFGRAGTDLIPILDQGSKGIADLTAQAAAEGAIMSGPQVDAAHQAYLAHQKLNEAMSGVALTLGSALMPYFAEAANWLSKHLPDAINTLHGWIDTHKQDIAHWAGVIKDVLAQAFQVLGNMLSIALPLLASLGQWIGQNLGLLTGLGGALSILYVGRKTGGLLGGLITDLGTLLGLISRVPASLPGTGGGGGGGVVPVGGAGGAVATAASVITTGAIVIAGAAALDIATVSVLNAVAPPGPADPGYKPKPGTRGIFGYIPDPAAESATEHMPTYLSKPGQAFDPAKNDQVITDAMQQYAAEILKERDNLPPKFNDLSDEIAKSVVAGSNVHNAMVDLAALTTAGVTTNQPQVRQYLGHWNEIQNGAIDTKDAQYEYASELASGKIKLGAPMAGFLQAWNIAHADGITMDQATAISAVSAQLAAKSGQDFASGVKGLAQQTHTSINQVLSAYTLTASFANSMMLDQQRIANEMAGLHVTTTGGKELTGYRLGQHGAVVNAPLSGEHWILHGQEAVLPRDKAPDWLWDAAVAAIGGQAPTLESTSPLSVVSTHSSPVSAGNGVTVNQTFHITGDPATVQAIIHQEFRSLELSLRAQ